MRTWQYLPFLEQCELGVTAQALLPDQQLESRYTSGSYGPGFLLKAYGARIAALLERRKFDAVWIEKEALPWLPAWLERALLSGVPYVLDYDDAIFHNYDLHPSALVRSLYARRLDKLMAGAALVVGGNGYLAHRPRSAGARWVEVLPSPGDLGRYTCADKNEVAMSEVPRIVWVGSPTGTRYLQLLREPLAALARRRPFKLRVIGAGKVDMPGVDVEAMPWSEATEVQAIGECAIGVMPLVDSPWERGKCGYKLIQYMACSLPVVASGVGVNPEVVQHRAKGGLASTPEQWERALAMLLDDAELRTCWGRAGREVVEARYSLQRTRPQLGQWLRTVATPAANDEGRGLWRKGFS